MITEDYVSFETAKLLKEKGFDCACKVWYSEYTSQFFGGKKYTSIEFDDHNRFDENYKFICYAPTLQMAMKWLREVYGIYPDIAVEEIDDNTTFFRVDGIYLKQKKMWDKYNNLFKTYEEACEEAIKYCLENLI